LEEFIKNKQLSKKDADYIAYAFLIARKKNDTKARILDFVFDPITAFETMRNLELNKGLIKAISKAEKAGLGKSMLPPFKPPEGTRFHTPFMADPEHGKALEDYAAKHEKRLRKAFEIRR